MRTLLNLLGCSFALIFPTIVFASSTPPVECESALKTQTADSLQLRFPNQLRLRPDKIQSLLQSEKFAEIVTELGALFYKLEARPEILHRLPHILNGAMSPPRLSEGLPLALRELMPTMTEQEMKNFAQRYMQLLGAFDDSQLSQHQIAWLAFLLGGLPVEPRLAPEFDPDYEKTGTQKLAYLTRALTTRPQHRQLFEAMMKSGGFRDLLTEDFNEILLRILSQGHTLAEDRYINTYREIVHSVENYERDFSLDSHYGLTEKERRNLQFVNVRGIISLFVVAPSLATRIEANVSEDELEEIISHNQSLILNFLEDIYFGTNFKKYDHQVFMDLMDLVIFGTPLPYSKEKIFDSILNTANRILLPAKNYGAQVKAESTRQKQEEIRQHFQIREFVLRPVIEAPPQDPQSFNPKKRRNQYDGRTNSSAPIDTPKIEKLPSILSFTKYANYRQALSDLKPGKIYELQFLRDSSGAKHRIEFDEESLREMIEVPLEAYQVLDGLVAGFTNRDHDGAGLKRIYQRQVLSSDIYEVRPNRGQYRMLLRRHNSHWRVESFVKKTEFHLEMVRIRGR